MTQSEWFLILENAPWFALGAIGFALLFNVPARTIPGIAFLAAAGGLMKVVLMHNGTGIILSSLAGASVIGVLSVLMAHRKHTPSIVVAIPAVIPMVPGVFAYRMLLGLLTFAVDKNSEVSPEILGAILKNGLHVALITMSLAIGVSVPFLLTRQKTGKFLKFL